MNKLSPMLASRQNKALDRIYQGGFTFRNEIETGKITKGEVATVSKVRYNRRKFNRMDAEQQREYDRKLQETKSEYRLYCGDREYFTVPKLVYDYYMLQTTKT